MKNKQEEVLPRQSSQSLQKSLEHLSICRATNGVHWGMGMMVGT